jgi:hypothetical protein
MGEKRMDGRMEMTERQTDQIKKKLKDSVPMESGKALALSYFLFHSLHNIGTKPCVSIISNLETIGAERICYLALFSLKCSHIKQSGHQLRILSFHRMCFLLF